MGVARIAVLVTELLLVDDDEDDDDDEEEEDGGKLKETGRALHRGKRH